MSGGGGRLRDIYSVFFTYHGALPDSVGKQNPKTLFLMLDSMEKNSEADIDGNKYLEMFYGK